MGLDDQPVEGYRPCTYNDPSANLWSAYLSQSEKQNQAMAQNWKGDMDAILIFAGLFSASLTAFIIESYKTLNSNPEETSRLILAQISLQLASMASNTTSPPGLSPLLSANSQGFSPSRSSLICNALWFLSLCFSLICALSATLVEQWTRHYLQATGSKPAPQDRARLSAYLYQGIKTYRMAAVVETIPLLLHVSLFLFFAGLVAFLQPVNALLQYIVLTLFILCSCLYFLVTILPILRLPCPFWTPLSTTLWAVLRHLQLLYRQDSDGNRVPVDCSMLKARQLDAIGITPDRDQRDFKAMSWAISGLREDNELETFVNIIPNVVSGIDYSAKLLLDNLMNHPDIAIRLRVRVPRLLASCTGVIDPSVARKRATTCLKAIWSLTMLSIPKPGSSHPDSFRESLRFKEDTFYLLYNIRTAIPSTDDFVCSTTVVLARSLMDMQIDRASALEQNLLDHIQTSDEIVESQVLNCYHPFSDHSHLEALKLRLQKLDSRMHDAKSVASSLPYAMLEAVATMQCRIGALAMDPSYPTDRGFILELVHCIREFQRILNQVGFSIVVEYATKVIHSNSPPHEAFNTFRRVFFRVNFGLSPFTLRSQEHLVGCLDEALDIPSGSAGLPQNIIDLLLSLTPGLTNPMCVLKAKGIIQSYARLFPQDTTFKALTMLEETMPSESQPSVVSELLCSHLSSDAKPSKGRKPTSVGLS